MRTLSRYRLVLILILGAVFAVLLLNEHLVPAGDNATYLVLGQALSTGQGYRVISDPRQPAMALYPPGYPAVLAGLLAVTGKVHHLPGAILPVKVLSIAFFLASIILAYDLYRKKDARLAAVVALLMAVNPSLLHFANEVGTESAYTFLALFCLWLFDRLVRRPSTRLLLGTAAALVAAFYVRSIALVLLVALVGHLVVTRRTKLAVVLVVVMVVMVVPWFVYASSVPDTGTSVGLGRGYFSLYFSSDPYGTEKASLQDWLVRIRQNVRAYCLEIWPDVLFPHASRVAKALGAFGTPFLAAIFALVAIGFILEARQGDGRELYAALFFGSCVGYLWPQSRLIVPIVPFAISYSVTGTAAFARALEKRQPRLARAVSPLICFTLALSAVVAGGRSIISNLEHGLSQPPDVFYGQDPEWNNYWQAIRWIDSQLERSTVVMCRKADLLYVYTALQALEYPYDADGERLKRTVQDNGVDFLIEDAFTWTRTTVQYLVPALQDWRTQQPEALVLVHETGAPRTRVWRVAHVN